MAEEDHRRAPALTPDDESSIRLLLDRLVDAWARGDGDGYGACFVEESDYITFNGIHFRSRAENVAAHSPLFRTVLKGTKLSIEIESLELLSSEVALVHTVGSGRKKSYQTYVLVKSDAEWLIRSFQNTRMRRFSIWITRWMQKRAAR